MATTQAKTKKDRTYFHVTFTSWALAVLGLVWAVTFNISTYRAGLFEARDYQKEKSREVEIQVQSYSSIATQLAAALQVFVERYQGGDKKQIEQYLDYFLESAPRYFIYGIGIWWEPFAFDPQLKHFGPYAYRKDPQSSRIITYEWSTPDYDYHKKFWYQSGIAIDEKTIVTSPYREQDVAYISLLKPFYDLKTGQKKGVISVDIVVPQIQDILRNLKTKPSDTIIVVAKSGHIIGHSRPTELLAQAKRLHPEQAIDSILDVRLADAMAGLENMLIQSTPMHSVGWTLVMISHPDEVLVGYHRIQRVIVLATLVYLLILALGYFTIRHFQQSLQRQRESALYTEKMASLGEMAGSIAHEINNPLAIVQGAAQTLQIRLRREELNREELKHTAALILKTADRIGRIIRSLRYVVRDGNLDPFVNTNIRVIVDETLGLCESKLKNENIYLDASPVPVDLCCVCRGVQISQVLINLINNSIDAIRELPEKWIRLEAYVEGAWIRIAVTDSGPGIPKDLAEKIMKPFFTTKSVGHGTGLGLSISRGIAQAHGGDLEVDLQCPHTRFVLTLPQAHENLQSA
ncbi:MAG TPA: ATP-binding protein [Oligoflexus sp.]|uniref:ATP-binding protein n=1 Tax=Oligoflexus sp. TaxID=1971216 RepID=UPI002D24F670|nr:ATP-binding protein [Oligoflexus sp.]HYX31666.1 ATP-binding protein [Oligoflexus sp.]